ncbi:MAG: response regulator [Spirochaetaceae bacterium]|nr:response regulator [Spirochaetaceae bacterium]
MKKILVIDDEEMIVDLLKIGLEDLGHQVTGFHDPEEGEQAALENDYDLILVDVRMPKRNGAEIIQSIRESRPEARILIMTAHPSDPLAQRALGAGALTLLKKPFEIGKILHFLEE